VLELVCRYKVTQQEAKSSCSGYHDGTVIPPVETHVGNTGAFVKEKNHRRWNVIQPVSSIKIQAQ
jgi:hypothetical protein